jgi:hypothetical protein
MIAVINSHLTVIASPLAMGFITALTKKVVDKMIVLVHPYIDIVDGEMRHKKRYKRYPALAMLLDKSLDGDDEDVQITTNIFRHSAANLGSRLHAYGTTDQDVKEVADAFVGS